MDAGLSLWWRLFCSIYCSSPDRALRFIPHDRQHPWKPAMIIDLYILELRQNPFFLPRFKGSFRQAHWGPTLRYTTRHRWFFLRPSLSISLCFCLLPTTRFGSHILRNILRDTVTQRPESSSLPEHFPDNSFHELPLGLLELIHTAVPDDLVAEPHYSKFPLPSRFSTYISLLLVDRTTIQEIHRLFTRRSYTHWLIFYFEDAYSLRCDDQKPICLYAISYSGPERILSPHQNMEML